MEAFKVTVVIIGILPVIIATVLYCLIVLCPLLGALVSHGGEQQEI